MSSIISDILWPYLEGEEVKPQEVDTSKLKQQINEILHDNNLDIVFTCIQKLIDNEYERFQDILRKTHLLFGSTGVTSAIAIILGMGRFILFDLSLNNIWINLIIIILYIVILIYFFQTIKNCLKVFWVKSYYIVSSKELLEISNVESNKIYMKNLLCTMVDYLERNYVVTNRTVDNYALAISFFRNGVYALFFLGILIGFLSLVINFESNNYVPYF